MKLQFRSDEQNGVWFVEWSVKKLSTKPYVAWFFKDYDKETGYGFWQVALEDEDVEKYNLYGLLTQLMLDSEMGNKYNSQGYSDVGYQKSELKDMFFEAQIRKEDAKCIKNMLK